MFHVRLLVYVSIYCYCSPTRACSEVCAFGMHFPGLSSSSKKNESELSSRLAIYRLFFPSDSRSTCLPLFLQSASKSKTIFRILQNCLALSQTLAAMGEANEKELRHVDVLSSKDGKAEASTRTGRSEVETLQHLQLEKI